MTKQFEELTDSQLAAISVFFNLRCKRKLDLRSICNALLYMVRTGCQWRNLPSCYPHWRAVNYYFEKWKSDGTIQRINDALNQLDRKREGKDDFPSLMCVDSQSVKLSPLIWEHRGLDANKKVNGRKRQFLVDSGGRIWRVLVHAAHLHDGPASCPIMDTVSQMNSRLKKILGDEAYKKTFALRIAEEGMEFERASKPESTRGFVPIAKRWVVERTIAWTNFFRRIVKDYEYTVLSSQNWIILANLTIVLQRLFPYAK
ncbi:MAG: IS5 family transposase [Saprospiraceae bacterium]